MHPLVIAYLRKLPHVPYRSLGLNCEVLKPQANPQRWVIERFGANWLNNEPAVLGMTPKFALDAGDAVCQIGVGDAPKNSERIALECNMHHQGPLDVDGLHAAIERWPERQAFILSSLALLLRSEQT